MDVKNDCVCLNVFSFDNYFGSKLYKPGPRLPSKVLSKPPVTAPTSPPSGQLANCEEHPGGGSLNSILAR